MEESNMTSPSELPTLSVMSAENGHRPSRRRGRSLSDTLTLERSEDGALVVSSINSSTSANQGLRRGDELLGATIDFDQLSKEEVLKVLKLMEPFDVNMQVVTKNNKSKSLENLDQYTKSPETMLKDSYSKLYNAKIKKYMRNGVLGEETSVESDATANLTAPASSRVNINHVPRLGVDFGLKTKTFSKDVSSDSQFDGTAEIRYDTNLNLPPLSLGSNRAQVPRLKANARSHNFHPSAKLSEDPNVNTAAGVQVQSTDSPSGDLSMTNFDRPQTGLNINENVNVPEVGLDLKGSHVSTPDMGINLNGDTIIGPSFDMAVPKVATEGTNKEYKMPKFKLPNIGLSRSSFSDQEYEVKTPGVDTPDIPSGQLNPKFSKRLKRPDLNIDDPSSYAKSPRVKLSGKSCNLDVEMPDIDVPQHDLKGPDIDMSSGGAKVQLKNSKMDLKSPHLDVDAPSGKLTWPKSVVSGKSEAHVPTPDPSLEIRKLKGDIYVPEPNLAIDNRLVDNKDQSGKYKAPKFTMPKFDLPRIQDLDFHGDSVGPHTQLAAPDLKPGIADQSFNSNVTSPHLDIAAMDVPPSKFKGGISLPGVDLKEPTLDLNTHDVNIGMPSGKLDIHRDGPSGKHKLQKFKLFGTLSKNKHVYNGEGMNTPELTWKSPMKDGMFAPDLSVPNVDLKVPKSEVHTPDVNMDSHKGKFTLPKLTFPSLGLSSQKGANTDVDASLKRLDLPSGGLDVDLSKPEFDIDSPSLDLKVPTSKLEIPGADIGSPSRKIKMPYIGLSGPKQKGLDGELKTPDFDISAPMFKGTIGSPDLSMPDIDLDKPRLELSGTGTRGMHVEAPSSKFKMSKFDLSGTLPKGPNLDIHTDLKSPDLNLKAPRIMGGIGPPDLDLPKMDIKAPKLDMNAPNVNIGSPKSKLKMPKLKMPKFSLPSLKGSEISGSFDGPDMSLNAPNVNFKRSKDDLEIPDANVAGSSGMFKMPNVNLPDFELSRPKLDGPNLDLKSPGLDISGPNLSGGINAPEIEPKLDLTTPDFDLKMPSGKVIKPELQTTDWDVNAPSGKLKIPKFNLSGTLPKGPNLDLNSDLKSPDLSLTAPRIEGGVHPPGLNLPGMDIKAPKVNVNAPNVNIGSPKSKLKMPKLKMPKFSLPSLNGPEISGSFDGPDMNLNAPNVNIKGSKADLELPDTNVTGTLGKFKMPKVNLPNLGLSGPNLNDPNLDFKSPKLDIAGPNLSWGINAPDIDMTQVGFRKPKLDLTTPEFGLKMPSGKGINPELHTPDWDVNAPSGKLKIPKLNLSGTLPKGPNLDLNSDLKSPDLNLTAPKIKGGIDPPDLNLPEMGLKTPKLDVNAPQIDIGSPKSKLKMPKLKMPKFSLPSLKGPEIESGSFDGPDMNLKAPNVNFKGSKADLEFPDANVAGSMGRFKMPNVYLPEFDLSGPHGPNLDIKSPGLNTSGPNLSGGINAPDLTLTAPKMKGGIDPPDLNLPKLDLKTPTLDLNAPNVNIGSPKGKVKMPKLKMPKFSLPSLKGPEIESGSFDGPDMNLNAPNVNFKGSKADLEFPDANVAGSMGRFKLPNVYLPEFDLSGPHGPNLDIKSPGLNTSGPNLSGGINAPDLTLTAPKMKGGIDPPDLNLPKLDLKTPTLDVNAPNVNIGSPKGKVKMPKMKMPKFGLPSLKGPEINGSLDGLDADLNVTNVNLKGPKADLEMPDVGISNPSVKFKKTNFNLPDLGLSGPKLKDPNLDLSSPKLHVSGPNISGGIKAPDINRPKVDLKSPKLNLNTPNLNLDMPSGQLDMPELRAPDWNMKTPKLDVEPDVNIGPPRAKFKMPKFKMPKFSLGALKGPAIDGNFNGPDVDLNSPNVNLNGSKADFGIDVGGPSGKFKKPNFHLPDFGLSGPKLGGPNLDPMSTDLDISGAKINGVDLKSPRMDFNTPKLDLEMPSGKMKMATLVSPNAELHPPHVNAPSGKSKFPKLHLSGTLPKGPNMNVNTGLDSPDFSLKSPKIKGGIDAPGFDFKSPKLDMNPPGVNIGSRQAELKMPKVNLPNLKGPQIEGNFDGPEIDNKATNLKVSKPDFEITEFGSPNMNLKAPKLDMNTLDVNIGFPEASIKKPKLKTPKGPNVDRYGELQSPDLNIPNVDGNRKLKTTSLNTQNIRLSRPKANTLEMNMSGPKLKSRDKSMTDLDLLGTKFRGQSDMNFSAPQVKRRAKGPDFDRNVPSGNVQRPKSDLDLVDRKFKLPFFKLPQFGSEELDRVGCDIDFGASLRSTNQNITPPNAKLTMRPPQLKGNITSPNVGSPNTDLAMPKQVMPNPQVHFKNPDLNIDDPSLNLKPYKKRRSRSKGGNMKNLDLNVDGDVGLSYTDRKSSRTKTRSSYPQNDAHLGPQIDFNRSDLNVDDFTGKDHVLRARASKVDQGISPSDVNTDMTDPRYFRGMPTRDIDINAKPQKTTQLLPNASLPHLIEDSRIRIPDSTDGYLVTVFPTQARVQKESDRKHNTLGRRGLDPTSVDLEVPGENDLKGSTFFFSNLI